MPRTQTPFAEMGGVAEHNHGFCAHVRYRDEQGALNNIRGPDRRHRHDAQKDLDDMRAAGAVGSTPPRVSLIDVAVAITGHDSRYSADAVRNVCEKYPEVSEKIRHLKFRGRGQRNTPVIDVKGAIECIFLLPGRHAARVRRQAAELLCRHLSCATALGIAADRTPRLYL